MEADYSRLLNNPGEVVDFGSESDMLQKELTTYKNEMLIANGLSDQNRMDRIDFIGAQPVSMRLNHIEEITQTGSVNKSEYHYLMCEKTDGVRYIMVLTSKGNCYLTGRNTSSSKENPYKLQKINVQLQKDVFQIYGDSEGYDANSEDEDEEDDGSDSKIVEIFDGELVLDKKNGQHYLKFLIFDCILHFGKKIFDKHYYDRLTNAAYFMQYNKMCYEVNNLPSPSDHPFNAAKELERLQKIEDNIWIEEDDQQEITISIVVKDFFKYKHVSYLFDTYIPYLPHMNDGIIFTKNVSMYKPGTDPSIIKWKPPSMNTIDFLLIPNTDSIIDASDNNDLFSERVIDLYVMENNRDRRAYELSFFDFMVVTPEFFNEVQEQIEKKGGSLGVVAECAFITLPSESQDILKQIYTNNTDMIMNFPDQKKDSDQDNTRRWISVLKTRYREANYSRGWTFERYRLDKNNSNNIQIAKDIVDSIRENFDSKILIQALGGVPLQQQSMGGNPAQSINLLEPPIQKKQKK